MNKPLKLPEPQVNNTFAQQPQAVDAERSNAYDRIELLLRNLLDDESYASYVDALDILYSPPAQQPSAESPTMGISLFDFCPNLGASTPEPSLRKLVRLYYENYFDEDLADRMATSYIDDILSARKEGK